MKKVVIKNEHKIDFVITYVDDTDINWQKKRQSYLSDSVLSLSKNYRSWDNLHYWFRCVYKYAPWVNKIYLVTDKQVPEWLNIQNEKIIVVNHEDFIPKEYLPVFSSHPIELNLHRIKGLNEHFVYFNDDTFLTGYVDSDYFFQDGLPCDYAVESPFGASDPRFAHICINNILAVNKKYNRRDFIINNRKRLYSSSYKYGKYKNIYFSLFKNEDFFGFESLHLPTCMLKSAYENVWKEFYDELNKTCSHRFRDDSDVNQYIITYWMYMHGLYHPYNWRNNSRLFQLNDTNSIKNNILNACNAILDPNIKLVCINDAIVDDFTNTKKVINDSFDLIVPERCEYEKF